MKGTVRARLRAELKEAGGRGAAGLGGGAAGLEGGVAGLGGDPARVLPSPGCYLRRRDSRAPGAGGHKVQVGRAAAGRTRNRPGRGSGGRGHQAGRSAPGGARGPSPRAADSRRERLKHESPHRGEPRERLWRGPWGGAATGCSSYPGTAGSTLLAAGQALHKAAEGSGGPGTARCLSAWAGGPRAGSVSGGRPR